MMKVGDKVKFTLDDKSKKGSKMSYNVTIEATSEQELKRFLRAGQSALLSSLDACEVIRYREVVGSIKVVTIEEVLKLFKRIEKDICTCNKTANSRKKHTKECLYTKMLKKVNG